MGTPLQVGNTLFGVIAVASYRKDAFNSADLELLENLAQQASLALDNAFQHAEVTHQSHLDSLTSVYNHGYFLELLKREAENAQIRQKPLSLIMIDIDHFKEYNDRYGHLIGDKVLISLIASIRSHIKSMDIVGRWGGEEFCVLLFNADSDQAAMIARRIQETLVILTVKDRDGNPISVPTISQGIAVFPDETDDIYTLVDLADQRLYIAKERGRNQIEPGNKFGNYTQPLVE
jgi:diguanylate cyclase (GGDEF)-like protein